MPKAKSDLGPRRLDAAAAIASLRRQFRDVFIDAGKAYTQVLVDEIPTYSGESQGAIRALAKVFDVPVFDNPVPGVAGRGNIGASQGHADIQLGPSVYSFSWTSDVFQYGINERYDVSDSIPLKKPGPYNSIEKASRAAQEVANDGLRRIDINPADFMR